jgi:hypothetical protein
MEHFLQQQTACLGAGSSKSFVTEQDVHHAESDQSIDLSQDIRGLSQLSPSLDGGKSPAGLFMSTPLIQSKKEPRITTEDQEVMRARRERRMCLEMEHKHRQLLRRSLQPEQQDRGVLNSRMSASSTQAPPVSQLYAPPTSFFKMHHLNRSSFLSQPEEDYARVMKNLQQMSVSVRPTPSYEHGNRSIFSHNNNNNNTNNLM